MKLCTLCGGERKLLGMFPVYADHVPPKDRKPFIEMECFICEGRGEITDEHAERIKAGQRLREKRKSAMLGLRHGAEVLGLSPSELSYAEQGRKSLEEVAAIFAMIDALPNQPEPDDD